MGFDETHLIPLVDEGLGNSAYLVDLGDGRALAVDAPYDLRAVRAAAERRGLVIGFAAETHLHADFVSGARQLAATDGAKVVASAAGGRRFEHVALADEDEVDLGGLTMRALATPGHTDEHLSFLLLDGDRPLGVFTGGSLIVGAAARTDLVDPSQTRRLARAQYASILRLAALPDEVAVWPTHGAGSFCSAPPDDDRVSTIGTERARNTLLRAPDGDAFADQLIASLGSFPPYFLRLADVNRAGPAVLTAEPRPAFLGAAEVSAARAGGATLVDVRPIARFAAGHITGSLSIALRPQFATWLGWLTAPDTPWVLVTDPGQDAGDAVWQALKIGHPAPIGHTTVEAWDGPLASLPLLRPDQLSGRQVLDVRQEHEYADGHLPGAVNVELGDLSGVPVAPEPYAVMCGHGERATTAASLLLRRGRGDVAVVAGGPEDWAEVTGRPLVEGR